MRFTNAGRSISRNPFYFLFIRPSVGQNLSTREQIQHRVRCFFRRVHRYAQRSTCVSDPLTLMAMFPRMLHLGEVLAS